MSTYESDLRSNEHYFSGEVVFITEVEIIILVFISSVDRALHRYRRGHVFKSRTGLDFFSGLIFTIAEVVFITAKIAFILTSLSAVQIYDFHIFKVVYR